MPSPTRAALVIQASFAPGKEPRTAKPAAPEPAAPREAKADAPARPAPAANATQKKTTPAKPDRAPHPATVTQKKAAPGKAERPPHPAATVQKKAAPGKAERPPHPATVMQRKAAPAKAERPPHPATVMQKKAAPARAERPPHPATVMQKKAAPSSSKAERPPHPATLPRGGRAAQPATVQGAFAAPPDLLRMGNMQRGKPLPQSIQRAMEEQLGGADFAGVRVHEGPEAAAIGALALTAGDHVFFAPGQYRPETRSGRALLGKQLAYVLQQREGRVTNPFGSGIAVVQDPALDAEAAARAGLARR